MDSQATQHLFLQFFMKNPCVPNDKYKRFIENLKQKSSSRQLDENSLIQQSNRILRVYGFNLKSIPQPNGDSFMILINEIEDLATKQETWSKGENRLFYSIIDEIVKQFEQDDSNSLSNDDDQSKIMSIKMNKAINLSRQSNITLSNAEIIIKNWIHGNWFKVSNPGEITLGVRTLAQRNTYLYQTYELSTCNRCNLVCFYAHACLECNFYVHDYCSTDNKCGVCFRDLLLNKKLKFV